MGIRTELLADHPECVAELPPDLGGGDEVLKDACRRSRLPIGVIALDDGGLRGAAVLAHETRSARRPLGPWIVCLFVAAGEPSGGIEAALVTRIEQIARQLGFPAIYADTQAPHPAYARLGWTPLQTLREGGRTVTLFRRELAR